MKPISYIFIFCLLLFCSNVFSQSDITSDDAVSRLLTRCSNSDACIMGGSLLLAPMFPWFQYPLDESANMPQLRRFNRASGVIDLMLSKTNDRFSGYKIAPSFYKKWFGLALAYDTYNNGELDDTMWSADFVIRLIPRRHFQPKLTLGWERIVTDKISGSGFRFSFFNYDVYFTRRFGMTVVNYIGWIKGYTIVSGDLGFEYYVYPTISFKALMVMRYFYSEFLYGVHTGLSIKL